MSMQIKKEGMERFSPYLLFCNTQPMLPKYAIQETWPITNIAPSNDKTIPKIDFFFSGSFLISAIIPIIQPAIPVITSKIEITKKAPTIIRMAVSYSQFRLINMPNINSPKDIAKNVKPITINGEIIESFPNLRDMSCNGFFIFTPPTWSTPPT